MTHSDTNLAPAIGAARATTGDDRTVALWLLVCAGMIFAMAVIGAITRLTESGLSIMEWAPLTGALPPLSTEEWQRLFAIYRQIPEYTEINEGMTLDEFKAIFWWEYIHRLWGRLIGVVFAVPFVWLLVTGRIRRALLPHLVAMFLLGGLQGALGWYMVASGFADRTDVSQYRLAAHLMAAVAIYAYVLWVAFGLMVPANTTATSQIRTLRLGLAGLLALILVTLTSGAFVAGLKAGLIYNTFPLMDGRLVPDGYSELTPWLLNSFENVAAVQFNHRVLATVTLAAAVGLWLWSLRRALDRRERDALALLAAIAVAQFALGVVTLLAAVPVWLGALHQAGALALFTAALWALAVLRTAPRRV